MYNPDPSTCPASDHWTELVAVDSVAHEYSPRHHDLGIVRHIITWQNENEKKKRRESIGPIPMASGQPLKTIWWPGWRKTKWCRNTSRFAVFVMPMPADACHCEAIRLALEASLGGLWNRRLRANWLFGWGRRAFCRGGRDERLLAWLRVTSAWAFGTNVIFFKGHFLRALLCSLSLSNRIN